MKYIKVLSLLLVASPAWAQSDLASWNVSVVHPDESKPEACVIVLTATLNEEWNVYASDFEAPIGPLPTTLALTPDNSYEPLGELQCENAQKAIDPSWSITYTFFSGKAEFHQNVRIKEKKAHIRGVIKGQYINKRNKHLRDFEEEFDVVIP
jgi:hypothetical protein